MLKYLVALLLISFTASSFALPILSNTLQDPMFGRNKNFVPYSFDSGDYDYDFNGIVGLNNCSGSLIKFKGDDNIDKKAIMLTNGHCMGLGSRLVFGSHRMPDMGEIIRNHPHRRKIKLFRKNNRPIATVKTTKVIYGTMTNTDLALYELEKTYRELAARYDVHPLVLNDEMTVEETPIEVISGYWKRGYNCRIDDTIHRIMEGVWIWMNSIRYSQPGCETIGGTSGSPVINAATREIIAINNTGNDDGELCTIMNPCEIDEEGNRVSRKGRSYGQQTYWIYSCLNADFELDLDIEGCKLPK